MLIYDFTTYIILQHTLQIRMTFVENGLYSTFIGKVLGLQNEQGYLSVFVLFAYLSRG